MKRTVATLCLSIALAGAAFGISRAETIALPALQSNYSAAALYDLGNFYARTGRPALAVLNYERARIFAPSDPDIRANLRHVRESLGGSVGAPAGPGGWWSQHDRWGNPNTVYWIGIAGLMLAGTSLLLRRPASRHRAVLGTGAAIGVAFMVLALGDAFATAPTLQESVAMFATPAGASPASDAEPLFTVPLADVVSVRDEHGGFDLIVDSQGREGWVASRDLQPVIPRRRAGSP
jgi:hypothetical protein